MNTPERDHLVVGIARRVFEEEAEGRSVDPQRLVWAAGVLDQRPTTLPAAPRQGTGKEATTTEGSEAC